MNWSAVTSPRWNGDPVSSSTSHACPTLCIHVPISETSWPLQKRRKSRWRSAARRAGRGPAGRRHARARSARRPPRGGAARRAARSCSAACRAAPPRPRSPARGPVQRSCVDVDADRRVGAQGGERAEEQRALALLARASRPAARRRAPARPTSAAAPGSARGGGSARAPPRRTRRPSRAGRESRRRCRPPARASRGSTRADAELLHHARLVAHLAACGDRAARPGRRARTGPDPCRACTSTTCSTRASAAAIAAAAARASSASNSTIGHTTTPSAASASSSGSNWA